MGATFEKPRQNQVESPGPEVLGYEAVDIESVVVRFDDTAKALTYICTVNVVRRDESVKYFTQKIGDEHTLDLTAPKELDRSGFDELLQRNNLTLPDFTVWGEDFWALAATRRRPGEKRADPSVEELWERFVTELGWKRWEKVRGKCGPLKDPYT